MDTSGGQNVHIRGIMHGRIITHNYNNDSIIANCIQSICMLYDIVTVRIHPKY